MQLTQSQIIARINRKIHNAKGKIGGDNELQDILNEALDDLRLDVDLVSAKRIGPNLLIFNNVYQYECPTDVDYDKIITFKPMDQNLYGLNWDRVNSNYFFNINGALNQEALMWPQYGQWNGFGTGSGVGQDTTVEANPNKYSIDFQDAEPFLWMRNGLGSMMSAQVSDTSSVEPMAQGLWVLTGDGTNLSADNERYITSGSSLRWDSAGSTSTITLTNSTFTAVDLSNCVDKGTFTFWVDLPTTLPESIRFRVGSSAIDYIEGTVTTRFTDLPFFTGWNQLGMNWQNMTETGTVDSENITYFQLFITNTVPVAQVGYHLDAIACHLGKEVVTNYYSRYLVIDNDGVRKEKFTEPDDKCVLEGQEINLLIDMGAMKASQELREYEDMKVQQASYTQKRDKNLERRPAETAIESTNYYNC